VKAGRGEEIVVGNKKVFKPKKDGASHGILGVASAHWILLLLGQLF
jgi:hypothetical protein